MSSIPSPSAFLYAGGFDGYKYDALNQRFESVIAELNGLKEERTRRQRQDRAMGLYIRTLKKSPQVLTEWSDTLWTVMVEKGVIHRDGSITFVSYNGNEITVGA